MTLLFIPLDDRPTTRDAVLDLAAAAGITLMTPERASLGSRDRGADVPSLWNWLHTALRQTAGPAACIASAEMLCFGGLVAARRSTRHWRNILPWLDEIHALADRVPTYLCAVIPRTPVSGGGSEDPDYWEKYGDGLREYAAAADRYGWMGDAASGRSVAEALERLPSQVVEALFQHRRRHLLINTELLIAAAQGRLRALLLGQDDTTAAGLSRMDREALERLAARIAGSGPGGSPTVLLTSGADELGATLFARWLNESAGVTPAVRIAYTFPAAMEQVAAYESTPLAQSVRDHVRAAGCRIADSDDDVLLWVHNFEGEHQREAAGQPEPAGDPASAAVRHLLDGAGDGERVVAVADVRYANGADRAFVDALLQHGAAGGIAAYAGWNTAGNALGSALAQAVTAFHVRRGTVSGDAEAARRMVIARLLDDWGYQAVVRPELVRGLNDRGGDATNLGADEATLEEAARAAFATHVVPLLAASFDHRISVRRVTFPWHRLFEAAVDFTLDPIHV